jgi:hypothetical protein
MLVSNAIPELIKQPGGAQRRFDVFGFFVIPVHSSSTLIQHFDSMQLFEVIHSTLSDGPSCYLALLQYKSRYIYE